jgi:hypothetical protein
MKKVKAVGIAVAMLLALAVIVLAQSPNGIRGAFTGDISLPSVFGFTFGDNTSTDPMLRKNGAYNLGVHGHIGGVGVNANTTTTPVASRAWGTVALSSNTATVTFLMPFTSTPVCIATDQTTAQLV